MGKTEEIVKYFYRALNLEKNLTEKELLIFDLKLATYLDHSKTGKSLGRTEGTVEEQLKNLIIVLDVIGLTEKEKIDFISADISVLNLQGIHLIEKFMLLNLINEYSYEQKKEKFLKYPNNLRTSNQSIIKRYLFAVQNGYPEEKINYSMLFKDTNEKYFEIFYINKYKKPYKKYTSEELDLLMHDFKSVIIEEDFIYKLIDQNNMSPIEELYINILSKESRGK